MHRFWLLALLAVAGFLPLACGNSSNPTTAASSSSSGSSFSYPYLANFGYYYNSDNLYNSYCSNYFLEPGGFEDITGVAVGNGYIFVGDDDWGEIEVFDMNGNYITFFWPEDADGDSSDEPEGMKVANNRLYVADSDSGYVNVYNIPEIIAQAAQTQNCNYVQAYASYSGFSEPSDVDVDSNGRIYVSDWDNDEVYVVAPDFNDETQPNWGDDILASTTTGVTVNGDNSLGDPDGITVDPSGQRVYVSDGSSTKNVIQVYDGVLNSKGIIGSSSGAPSTVAGQFDEPWGIRMDNQGNLIVADNGYNLGYPRVQRLSTSGSVLNIIGASTTVVGGLYSPAYVAVDSNNNVYVTDNNVSTVDIYAGK